MIEFNGINFSEVESSLVFQANKMLKMAGEGLNQVTIMMPENVVSMVWNFVSLVWYMVLMHLGFK